MMTEPGAVPVVGEEITACWTPLQAEFDGFAEVSGDNNPIHVDPDFSARTRFGRTVSHGMLIYSKIWGMLQNRFPGCRQIEQTLMFPAPSYTGEELQIAVRIEAVAGSDLDLAMAVHRIADHETVLSGTSRIRLAAAS